MRPSRRGWTGWLVALAVTAAPATWAYDDADVRRVLDFAARQLAATAERTPPTQYPKYTRPDGTWVTVPNTALIDWSQGFWPGCLWSMFEAEGEDRWRDWASVWTRNLELQKTNRQTHDLGFKFMPSFGNAYRLTQNPVDKDVLLTAAASLSTRYNAKLGIITTGDWNPAWRAPMVIDTMMNLELLLWAAQNGGRPEWRDMAVSHALKTARDLIRPDGSTWQVVDYDPNTGNIRLRGTYQGYSDDSTWARGHAWAIYGFTMVYRFTRDPRMLEQARRVTDWYLARIPSDYVPKWDFDAPDNLKDSSAAAATASALLELSTYVDPETGARYREAAIRTLESLSSPAYLAEGTKYQSILLHGHADVLAEQGIDAGLIYGDYYFLEAVLRFREQSETPPPPSAPPTAEQPATPDAGTPPPPGEPPPEDDGPPGAGCSTGAGARTGALALLVAWGLLRARRGSAR